jgi:hypothetical protein
MARTKTGHKFKPIPNQVAVRYRKGKERKVSAALSELGAVEDPQSVGMLILHRAPRVTQREVAAVLDELRERGAIDFTTAVLRDADSGTRQVLTDEIVVRLKQTAPQRRTLASLKAEHGVQIGKQNAYEPTQYIVKVPDPSGTNTLDVARSLDRCDAVEFASPNFLTTVGRRA